MCSRALTVGAPSACLASRNSRPRPERSGCTLYPRAMARDPTSPAEKRTLYVGTGFGVFVTRDGGATWANGGSGLEVAPRILHLVLEATKRTRRAVKPESVDVALVRLPARGRFPIPPE
jgi:hypothetical protein